MANSVTFPTALGGDGSTVTDDADPTTGLANGGHRLRFVPALSQAVIMSQTAASKAAAAAADRQQTGLDRTATGQDRTAVADDRTAVEGHLADAEARIGSTQELIDARDAAQTAQTGAEAAETGALQAQTDAEAARDAAAVAGQVYADTAAGLAATGDGQYFKTPAASAEGFLTLYRNDGGVADPIDTFPSLNGLAAAIQAVNEKTTRLNRSFSMRPYNGESLRLDFVNQAFGQGSALEGVSQAYGFDEVLDFSRASTATYFDVAGVLQTAAVDEPRFDHDPVTGEALGMLVEESRTNLVPYSYDLREWESTNISKEASSASKSSLPTTSLSILEGVESGSASWVRYQSVFSSSTASGRVVQFVLRFLFDGSDTVRIGAPIDSNVSERWWAVIETDTGNVDSVSGIDLGNVSSRAIGDGFFEYTLTLDDGVEYSQDVSIRVDIGTAGESEPVELLEVMHVSAEEATAFPTSYIPTNGSAVTRSKDDLSRTIGEELNQSAVTFFVEYRLLEAIESGAAQISPFSVTGILEVTGSTTPGKFNLWVNNNLVEDISGLTGKEFKTSVSWNGSATTLAICGTSTSAINSPSISQGKRLDVGGTPFASNEQAVHIKRLEHYPRAMSAAELEALTA
ncbi:phage head spike fiber domain-containing protein [Halomonas smyrnensis]|uniref:phage head spike fiber domain-containing protein n=1 Tax=Halomonas smyrnensis TaxID=720605 RepID=UPI0002E1D357|nr:hypothetical protein [Halomonas smyrnensis]